jgi:ornithine cyclodeaminase/alanine dehydrogenase-like protein (mu-crystallin family)
MDFEMKTLIITQQEVKKILTPSTANEIVERAFRAYGLGQVDMPPKSLGEEKPETGPALLKIRNDFLLVESNEFNL